MCDMEIDKCKNCKYCTITKDFSGDGNYIELYCWNPTETCPTDNN